MSGFGQNLKADAVGGLTEGLGLAAAPTFAIMALLTATQDGVAPILCSTTMDVSPLGGMVPMYLLMSIFHAAPWLKLIFRQYKY